METKNEDQNTHRPEKDGKVPASGVISETYKEEVNPKDLLANSSGDPEDPEESNLSREEDINSYPLEEADVSPQKDKESDRNKESDRTSNNTENDHEQDIPPSATNEDEFLK